jgi:two-component system chemotaxis sensor kinase CheA
MSLDTSPFIAKFVEEARDRVKALTSALLRLEEAPGDGEALAEVLRQGHNLKGSARMLGLLDISQLAHHVEELFVSARGDSRLLSASAFDVVFPALDALSLRIERLASGMTEPAEVTALCEALAALATGSTGSGVHEPAEDTVPAGDKPDTKEAAAAPLAIRESVRVPVDRLEGLSRLAAELVIQNLKTAQRQADLRRLENTLGRLRDRMREVRLAQHQSGHGPEVGECAEALDQVSRRLRQFLGSFTDDCVRLHLITEEFRQTVIELTMLPVGTVFDAFPRAVRDLARHFDKEVELTVRGRETELDKKIVEHIADPLVHLLRNAIDHGIEAPGERERKGKPAAGQLLLSAEQQGNRIIVTMRDDGQGIDPEALRAAAIRGALAPAAELERWSHTELLDLVFQPGFSTRASATDVSGRGVGMDVVKDVVLRLGGAVRIHSELHVGTTVTLDLPLSLALLRVVLVETGGELFALPTAAVRRVLHLRRDEMCELPRGLAIETEGETIPLAILSVLLSGTIPPPAIRQPILVAAAGDHLFGLLVDAVHEEQELVFEELRHPLRDQRTFSGAAILGDGQIVPILDVPALFELAGRNPGVRDIPVPVARAERRPRRVLVVEDSLVAGELQKSILVAAGYESEIAHDGAQALEMLAHGAWDLVIADVDMPRIDGFELTARLRADARLRMLPVIIVTARESAEDRRRGFDAGADAYVLKREFDQVHLLETVQRLMAKGAAAHV